VFVRETGVPQNGGTGLYGFDYFCGDIARQCEPRDVREHIHRAPEGLLCRTGHAICFVQYYYLVTWSVSGAVHETVRDDGGFNYEEVELAGGCVVPVGVGVVPVVTNETVKTVPTSSQKQGMSDHLSKLQNMNSDFFSGM